MENRANYFYIGVFVFGVLFLSLIFIVWLSGFSHKEKFDYYQILTQESISGLGIKAPVRLLGVDVGSVEETKIDTKRGIGVRIIIKVKEGTPIRQNTYANFSIQGITGLKYVELKIDKRLPPIPLERGEEGEMPFIQVRPGFLSNIDTQGRKLADILDFIDERLRELLSEKNVKNFAKALQNFAALNGILEPAFGDLSIASRKVAGAADGYGDLKGSLMPTIVLLEQLLVQLNEILTNLKQSPSDILFKSGKNKLAPGE